MIFFHIIRSIDFKICTYAEYPRWFQCDSISNSFHCDSSKEKSYSNTLRPRSLALSYPSSCHICECLYQHWFGWFVYLFDVCENIWSSSIYNNFPSNSRGILWPKTTLALHPLYYFYWIVLAQYFSLHVAIILSFTSNSPTI